MEQAEARSAWQPLTPAGVAAFAKASLGRLLVVEVAFALLAAATAAWFVHRAWFPVVDQAVSALREGGELRSGRLDWQGTSPTVLAEGRYLSIAVDLRHEGGARSPAHIEVELGERDLTISSLFGFARAKYPNDRVVPLNHPETGPWWGAWAPVLLAALAAVVAGGLMALWGVLATLYAAPAWLLAYFSNRDLSLRGSWRLSAAALMPGALLMTGAIAAYGMGGLEVVAVLLAAGVHLVAGWVYLVLGVLALPGLPAVSAVTGNPFCDAKEAADQSGGGPGRV